MQISKRLLAVCAVTGVVALSASGDDTPEQAKARDALRKAMNQSPPAAASPAPAAPAAPPPPTAPAAAAPAPAQPPPAALPTAPSADSEAIERARDAMRRKMNEVGAGTAQTPAPAPVAPPTVTAPALAPAPAPTLNLPPAADPQAIAKAREALRQKMQELDQQQQAQRPVMPAPFEPAQAAVPQPPAQSTINFPPSADPQTIDLAREAMRKKMGDLPAEQPAVAVVPQPPSARRIPPSRPDQGYSKLEAPPLPISAEKQQQLAELLRRYRADEVTPEQYHAERARILTGP